MSQATRAQLSATSTVTARGQTTIPSAIRKALNLQPADTLRYTLMEDGTITFGKNDTTEADPAVTAFLSFLAQDMQDNPGNLSAVSQSMLSRAQALVKDIEVDLDEPLDDD